MATKSNVSYNGNFITYDSGTDYQAKINDAVKKGDYASAAQYEVQRNAKLSDMGRGNEATTNYASVYKDGTTNNKGGTIYTDRYNIGNAPSDWTTISSQGSTYKNTGGVISQKTGGNNQGATWTQVGNGLNQNTGEFVWNNPDQARDYVYNQYLSSGGNKNVSKDYALNNLVDKNYVNAITKGSVGQYTSDVIAKAQEEMELRKAIKAKKEERKKSVNYGDINNSFESNYEDPKEENLEDIYNNYIRTITGGSRIHVK